MDSEFDRRNRRSRGRAICALAAALCAVALTLTVFVAPSAGVGVSPASGGTHPADAGPPPEPAPEGGGARRPPCRSKACRKLVEKFCKKFDCGKLSHRFRKAKRGSAFARRVLKKHDRAVRDVKGWEAHHVVSQGRTGSRSSFAHAVLRRAGIKPDDRANLLWLRGPARQVGKPGYDELPTEPPTLRARAAHADTLTRYYDQTVNARLAALIRRVGNNPTKAQVRAVLRRIQKDLKSTKETEKYIKPGNTPRSTPFRASASGGPRTLAGAA